MAKNCLICNNMFSTTDCTISGNTEHSKFVLYCRENDENFNKLSEIKDNEDLKCDYFVAKINTNKKIPVTMPK